MLLWWVVTVVSFAAVACQDADQAGTSADGSSQASPGGIDDGSVAAAVPDVLVNPDAKLTAAATSDSVDNTGTQASATASDSTDNLGTEAAAPGPDTVDSPATMAFSSPVPSPTETLITGSLDEQAGINLPRSNPPLTSVNSILVDLQQQEQLLKQQEELKRLEQQTIEQQSMQLESQLLQQIDNFITINNNLRQQVTESQRNDLYQRRKNDLEAIVRNVITIPGQSKYAFKNFITRTSTVLNPAEKLQTYTLIFRITNKLLFVPGLSTDALFDIRKQALAELTKSIDENPSTARERMNVFWEIYQIINAALSESNRKQDDVAQLIALRHEIIKNMMKAVKLLTSKKEELEVCLNLLDNVNTLLSGRRHEQDTADLYKFRHNIINNIEETLKAMPSLRERIQGRADVLKHLGNALNNKERQQADRKHLVILYSNILNMLVDTIRKMPGLEDRINVYVNLLTIVNSNADVTQPNGAPVSRVVEEEFNKDAEQFVNNKDRDAVISLSQRINRVNPTLGARFLQLATKQAEPLPARSFSFPTIPGLDTGVATNARAFAQPPDSQATGQNDPGSSNPISGIQGLIREGAAQEIQNRERILQTIGLGPLSGLSGTNQRTGQPQGSTENPSSGQQSNPIMLAVPENTLSGESASRNDPRLLALQRASKARSMALEREKANRLALLRYATARAKLRREMEIPSLPALTSPFTTNVRNRALNINFPKTHSSFEQHIFQQGRQPSQSYVPNLFDSLISSPTTFRSRTSVLGADTPLFSRLQTSNTNTPNLIPPLERFQTSSLSGLLPSSSTSGSVRFHSLAPITLPPVFLKPQVINAGVTSYGLNSALTLGATDANVLPSALPSLSSLRTTMSSARQRNPSSVNLITQPQRTTINSASSTTLPRLNIDRLFSQAPLVLPGLSTVNLGSTSQRLESIPLTNVPSMAVSTVPNNVVPSSISLGFNALTPIIRPSPFMTVQRLSSRPVNLRVLSAPQQTVSVNPFPVPFLAPSLRAF